MSSPVGDWRHRGDVNIHTGAGCANSKTGGAFPCSGRREECGGKAFSRRSCVRTGEPGGASDASERSPVLRRRFGSSPPISVSAWRSRLRAPEFIGTGFTRRRRHFRDQHSQSPVPPSMRHFLPSTFRDGTDTLLVARGLPPFLLSDFRRGPLRRPFSSGTWQDGCQGDWILSIGN